MNDTVSIGMRKAWCVNVVAVAGILGTLQFVTPARAADSESLLERGRYLATAGDCVACHTAPGGQPFAGGLYMPTPFGDISTPNITPDKATGIGNWSDEQFYKAMHEGIGADGEYLYPVFPFPWFTKVTRDDVLAIKAYLFSLPPQDAPRKPLKLGFPFNVRTGLLAWRTAFFKPGTFEPDPQQSEAFNRGAYLVEGLGHCGECHNGNKLFGASDWAGRLEGGQIEGWYAPSLQAESRDGLGSWTDAQLVTYLKTGAAPGKGVALGPMQETIERSLSHLSEADLQAMATYLKSSANPDAAQSGKQAASSEVAVVGAAPYLSHCAFCHGVDGRGMSGMIPALAGNGAVLAEGAQNIEQVVLGGLEAAHGRGPMPAVGVGMSDQDIADAANYVRTAWGNNAPANAEPGAVAELRDQTHTLLAGNVDQGCPAVEDPKLAAMIKEAGVAAQLRGAKPADMLERIDAILAKLQASGVADDALVNALTVAYCPAAMAEAGDDRARRAELLGNFAVLAYGQIKHGEAHQ